MKIYYVRDPLFDKDDKWHLFLAWSESDAVERYCRDNDADNYYVDEERQLEVKGSKSGEIKILACQGEYEVVYSAFEKKNVV